MNNHWDYGRGDNIYQDGRVRIGGLYSGSRNWAFLDIFERQAIPLFIFFYGSIKPREGRGYMPLTFCNKKLIDE